MQTMWLCSSDLKRRVKLWFVHFQVSEDREDGEDGRVVMSHYGPTSCRHNVVSLQHQVVQRFLLTDKTIELALQGEPGSLVSQVWPIYLSCGRKPDTQVNIQTWHRNIVSMSSAVITENLAGIRSCSMIATPNRTKIYNNKRIKVQNSTWLKCCGRTLKTNDNKHECILSGGHSGSKPA